MEQPPKIEHAHGAVGDTKKQAPPVRLNEMPSRSEGISQVSKEHVIAHINILLAEVRELDKELTKYKNIFNEKKGFTPDEKKAVLPLALKARSIIDDGKKELLIVADALRKLTHEDQEVAREKWVQYDENLQAFKDLFIPYEEDFIS